MGSRGPQAGGEDEKKMVRTLPVGLSVGLWVGLSVGLWVGLRGSNTQK